MLEAPNDGITELVVPACFVQTALVETGNTLTLRRRLSFPSTLNFQFKPHLSSPCCDALVEFYPISVALGVQATFVRVVLLKASLPLRRLIAADQKVWVHRMNQLKENKNRNGMKLLSQAPHKLIGFICAE